MDPWAPYLLQKHIKNIKKINKQFKKHYFWHISTFSGQPQIKIWESAGHQNFENCLILMGPTQLVSPSVLNKNGEIGWWNLNTS